MPQSHEDRCANAARHDRCYQPPGLVPVRPTGFLAGHAEPVANLVPAAPMTACLRHKLSDPTGRDGWVVPCQADSGQVRHVLTNCARVLGSELILDVSQLVPHVLALAHLPVPLRPAGLVATMPTQPVKVDDCFVWGVFSVDADLNIAALDIK
jgi:hypothetical protein